MKKLAVFRISSENPAPQALAMPRRARITGIKATTTGPRSVIYVYAEVEHDADTAAFDKGQHMRAFVQCLPPCVVPDGALVGFHNGVHVYEVKP